MVLFSRFQHFKSEQLSRSRLIEMNFMTEWCVLSAVPACFSSDLEGLKELMNKTRIALSTHALDAPSERLVLLTAMKHSDDKHRAGSLVLMFRDLVLNVSVEAEKRERFCYLVAYYLDASASALCAIFYDYIFQGCTAIKNGSIDDSNAIIFIQIVVRNTENAG